MLNTNFVVVLLISLLNSYKSIAQKKYYFQSKESTIYDISFTIKPDSLVEISGGQGQYSYWSFGKIKKITNEKYLFFIPKKYQGGVKVKITDSIRIKSSMRNHPNDTLYFSDGKKSFFHKDRIFKIQGDSIGNVKL